ncbi:hypothetical protein FB451DRAFT_1526642 [Mycena latifolia]|nr:hypothetical protein FB451DRAFT_1526642 [Mycena latifolia]
MTRGRGEGGRYELEIGLRVKSSRIRSPGRLQSGTQIQHKGRKGRMCDDDGDSTRTRTETVATPNSANMHILVLLELGSWRSKGDCDWSCPTRGQERLDLRRLLTDRTRAASGCWMVVTYGSSTLELKPGGAPWSSERGPDSVSCVSLPSCARHSRLANVVPAARKCHATIQSEAANLLAYDAHFLSLSFERNIDGACREGEEASEDA